MSTVYAKTPKGHSELESRSGGLKPKVRRVLIMVDGHRDLDEVARLSASDDASLSEAIDQLRDQGYIELASNTPPLTTVRPMLREDNDTAVAPPMAPPKPAEAVAPPADTTAAPMPPPGPAIIAPADKPGPNQTPSDPFGGIIKI